MKKILLGFCLAGVLHLGFISTVTPTVYAQGYTIDLRESLPGPDGKPTKTITADNGVELVMKYIGMIYKFGASIIGVVCVLIIVFSGVQIAFGGINNSMVSQAKDRIIQALFSLILLFGSFLVLRTVNPGYFGA